MGRKSMTEKSCLTTKGSRATTAARSSQQISEGMKLAVALQLKVEGYESVVFNKVVKVGGKSVVIDVFAEDCLGSMVAVYCVNRTDKAEEGHLNDVACTILDGLGEECLIAFAYPLRLVGLVRNAIGLANRIYMVDDEGRVWRHDPGRPHDSIRPWWMQKGEFGKEAARLDNRNPSMDTTRHDFYVA